MIFPFMALVLLMFFCGKNFERCYSNPIKVLAPALMVPLSVLMFSQNQETMVIACDATLGVSLIVLCFLYSLRSKLSMNNALAVAATLMIGYGLFRTWLFGSQIQMGFEQALQTVRNSLLMLDNDAANEKTLMWMRVLLPSMWMIQMLIALLLGFVIYQSQVGIKFSISRFTVSKYYSLILLTLIPLYILKNMQVTLINGVIAYSFLPLIQGIGVMISKLSKIMNNSFLMGLIVAIVLINAVSYIILALIGIADQWLDIRKLDMGEISHESNNA